MHKQTDASETSRFCFTACLQKLVCLTKHSVNANFLNGANSIEVLITQLGVDQAGPRNILDVFISCKTRSVCTCTV